MTFSPIWIWWKLLAWLMWAQLVQVLAGLEAMTAWSVSAHLQLTAVGQHYQLLVDLWCQIIPILLQVAQDHQISNKLSAFCIS